MRGSWLPFGWLFTRTLLTRALVETLQAPAGVQQGLLSAQMEVLETSSKTAGSILAQMRTFVVHLCGLMGRLLVNECLLDTQFKAALWCRTHIVLTQSKAHSEQLQLLKAPAKVPNCACSSHEKGKGSPSSPTPCSSAVFPWLTRKG